MTCEAPASFSISAEMSPVCGAGLLPVAVLAAALDRRARQDFGGARQQRRGHAEQRFGFGVETAHETVPDRHQLVAARHWCRSSSSCRRRAGGWLRSSGYILRRQRRLTLEFTTKIEPQSNRQWRRKGAIAHRLLNRRGRKYRRAQSEQDMLDALRTAAGTWVAKLLLFMLVISFAIWGISGRMIGGFGSSHVITAGGTTVSLKDYRLAYDRQIQVMSQQLGTRLTREQAAAFGDRQPGAGATGRRRGARRAGAQARPRRLQGPAGAARARGSGLQGSRRQRSTGSSSTRCCGRSA